MGSCCSKPIRIAPVPPAPRPPPPATLQALIDDQPILLTTQFTEYDVYDIMTAYSRPPDTVILLDSQVGDLLDALAVAEIRRSIIRGDAADTIKALIHSQIELSRTRSINIEYLLKHMRYSADLGISVYSSLSRVLEDEVTRSAHTVPKMSRKKESTSDSPPSNITIR